MVSYHINSIFIYTCPFTLLLCSDVLTRFFVRFFTPPPRRRTVKKLHFIFPFLSPHLCVHDTTHHSLRVYKERLDIGTEVKRSLQFRPM